MNLFSQYGKVPDGANIIVRPIKELSSGNQTPSSTSVSTKEYFLINSAFNIFRKRFIISSFTKFTFLVLFLYRADQNMQM